MSTELYILISVLEAVLLVVVLALALIRIRQRLNAIANDLTTLGSALGGIEKDLVLIGLAVPMINKPLFDIVGEQPYGYLVDRKHRLARSDRARGGIPAERGAPSVAQGQRRGR
jgi:hypothetical protein